MIRFRVFRFPERFHFGWSQRIIELFKIFFKPFQARFQIALGYGIDPFLIGKRVYRLQPDDILRGHDRACPDKGGGMTWFVLEVLVNIHRFGSSHFPSVIVNGVIPGHLYGQRNGCRLFFKKMCPQFLLGIFDSLPFDLCRSCQAIFLISFLIRGSLKMLFKPSFLYCSISIQGPSPGWVRRIRSRYENDMITLFFMSVKSRFCLLAELEFHTGCNPAPCAATACGQSRGYPFFVLGGPLK